MTLKTVLNWTIVFASAGTLAYVIVDSSVRDSKEKAWKDTCTRTADAMVSKEDQEIIDARAEISCKIDDILADEATARKAELDAWKKETNWEDSVKEANEEYNNAVSDWKRINHYDQRLSAAANTRDEKIKDYISTVEYNKKLASLNGQIEAAKKKFKSEKAVVNAVSNLDDKLSEGASAMEKEAQRIKDETIKECKNKIKELEDEKNAFAKKVNDMYSAEVMGIKEDFRLSLHGAKDKRDKKIAELVDQADAKSKSIHAEQVNNRTEEQAALFEKVRELNKQAMHILEKSESKCEELIKAGSDTHKIACSYLEKGIGHKKFLFMASMPVVLVCAVTIKYVSYILEIAKCMRDEFVNEVK